MRLIRQDGFYKDLGFQELEPRVLHGGIWFDQKGVGGGVGGATGRLLFVEHVKPEVQMPKKMSKPTIKKAHRIARAIKRSGGRVSNPWAVGTAVAKKSAAKRKRKRSR